MKNGGLPPAHLPSSPHSDPVAAIANLKAIVSDAIAASAKKALARRHGAAAREKALVDGANLRCRLEAARTLQEAAATRARQEASAACARQELAKEANLQRRLEAARALQEAAATRAHQEASAARARQEIAAARANLEALRVGVI